MFRQFSRFPGILEVPGPEIRILCEISSPEPAGNLRKNKIFRIFPGNFPENSGKCPGNVPGHFQEISRMFPEISRKIPGKFLEMFLDISWKFPGHFSDIPGTFPEIPGNFPDFFR